jgi:hypothetical protein
MSYTPVVNNPQDQETPFPLYGPTTSRPPMPAVTQMYFDTTLGEPVWWTGATWVDAVGAPV